MSSRITHTDLQAALPDVTSTLHLSRLQQPTDIYRDSWGIPHIRAENEHDAFFAFERASKPSCDIILPLALLEGNQRNLLIGNELLNRLHESTGDRFHHGCRRHLVTAMMTNEPENAFDRLQSRDVHVQVHPVNPFDFQRYVLLQDFRSTARYARARGI